MSQNLTIVESAGVLKLSGSLDIYAVEAARAALLEHLDHGAPLHLDLSAVQSCDTAGIQLLCSAQKTATQRGQSFRAELSASVRDGCSRLGLTTDTF